MKLKTFLIIFFVVIIGGGAVYFFLNRGEKQPEYVTAEVAKGTLKQTVEATGKIESAERIGLNFKTTGRIAKVLADVGDKVASGQVLARLEARSLESRVSDARAGLLQEKADYEKLMAGASDKDVQVSQETVNQKRQDLASEENDLESLKIKRDTELLNLRETAVITLKSELVAAETALEKIDKILEDEDAEYTLGVKDIGSVNSLRDKKSAAAGAVAAVSQTASGLSSVSPDSEISGGLDKAAAALDKVLAALSSAMAVLNATITSPSFSTSDLDTFKTAIQTQQTTINTSKTSLQTAKSNWSNKIAYYDDLIKTAENEVKKADTALRVAESQLALKVSPPRSFEIDAQKAQISQAEAALNLALANLEETIIYAPLAGTIVKKNFTLGEQTNLSEPVFEMIGESNLQIKVDIPESDIAKVAIGQEAEITLDAFSDDRIFGGKVIFVDPAETVIQDVVYYKVKAQLDKQYEEIKPGMTANVTIYTAKKEDILFAPARAIKSRDGERYVEVLNNLNQPEKRTVTLGLKGDDGIEILSGLEAGEKVITFVKE